MDSPVHLWLPRAFPGCAHMASYLAFRALCCLFVEHRSFVSLKDLMQGEMKITCNKNEDLGNIFCR